MTPASGAPLFVGIGRTKDVDGDWRMVVMNSSGSSRVTAQMKVGVKTNVLLWIGLALLGAGLVSTAAGASLLLVSRKRG